jgi:hypothetical protein
MTLPPLFHPVNARVYVSQYQTEALVAMEKRPRSSRKQMSIRLLG